MKIAGTYPMVYAFFDGAGALRREAVEAQVAAVVASGAEGIAVLGLGSEVSKLGRAERRTLLDWTVSAAAGRLPVAATISAGNLPDLIEEGREAHDAGAAWLILQPPRPPASGADLIAHFGAAADAMPCPIAIQNAPEFLGIGLTPPELAALHDAHPNVVAVKAECTALALGELSDALDGRMRILNGRAGLELTDNYRAGAHGMIPGVETADLQVAIAHAMAAGREAEAEDLYRRVLPAVAFIMQGLAQFTTYGKLLAAMRLGIAPSSHRGPGPAATERGHAWTRRFADALGPLPT